MPHHGEQPGAPFVTTLPTYTVYRENATYYAVNNSTGEIDFNGADPAVVVQACLTAGGAGTVVGLREANYVALTGVAATANNQGIYGMGRGTYWDATALLTGTHAFTISGFTDCMLRNFAIETDAGGTLVNHCIYIENAADNFHIIDIIIVNSDSDGVHIEGATITGGHIHRLHVEAADGAGILQNMAMMNNIYRLHIEDCDIVNVGTIGISMAGIGAAHYCQIVNNVIFNAGGDGIYFRGEGYNMVRGNLCIGCGGSGIEINSSNDSQVLGNICLQNVEHGIFISTSDYCVVEGNHCLKNDSGDTGNFDGINIFTCDRALVLGNQCQDQQGWGIQVDDNSNWCKITSNYTALNVAGSINVNGATCDNNEVVWNTVEEGAPVDTGTLTRASGNFDPSANAYIALIGAAPF